MTTIAYIANAESRDISVLQLDTVSGAVDELQRADTQGKVMPLTVSPDRRFLHASIRSEPIAVASFAIDAQSGRLTPIGRCALPASSCWIGTDRSGRFLLSASYGESLIAVSPIDGEGAVGPAQQTEATELNAHSVKTDPANRFLYAACLGGGAVLGHRFDAASGRFTRFADPVWHARPGAGPRHFVFHRGLPFVYLVNELDAAVDVFRLDRQGGFWTAVQTIGSMPAGFDGEPWAADIHLTPDGRFLYTCERRSSTIAAFAVDPATGLLTLLGHTDTEQQPRSFAIDPSGHWLLAVGQGSHRLSSYAIDAASGALAKRHECAVGRDPNWIEIVELG